MAGEYEGVYNSNGKCQIRWQEDRRRSIVLPIAYSPAGIKKAYQIRAQYMKAWRMGVTEVDHGSCPTVGALQATVRETSRWSANTLHNFDSSIKNYWHQFYRRQIDTISYDEILRAFAPHRDTLTHRTIKQHLLAGSLVWQLAIESKHVTDNLPRKVLAGFTKTAKKVTKVIDPFSRQERDDILGKLNGVARRFFLIRFYTGMRPGEVLALRWSDYDGSRFSVTKTVAMGEVAERTKTGVDRMVPVHPIVQEMLKTAPRHLTCDRIIFNRFGLPFKSPGPMNVSFANARERLGIRPRSPYNARHTAASLMLEAGMDPNYCAQILGHTVSQFFEDYATWINGDALDAQAAIWAKVK